MGGGWEREQGGVEECERWGESGGSGGGVGEFCIVIEEGRWRHRRRRQSDKERGESGRERETGTETETVTYKEKRTI